MTNKERMSQIGEVMDELIKLGFEKSQNEIGKMNYFAQDDEFIFNHKCMISNLKYIIFFEASRIIIAPPFKSAVYLSEYTPTWQQDLLDKVRELIGDKS